MDDLKKALSPISDSLPKEVRDFLDAGGWWLVLAVVALALLLLMWALLERIGRALFGRRSASLGDFEGDFQEFLAGYSAPTAAGKRRLTVYHLPARLALVVLAPAGTEVGLDGAAAEVLDRVVPGLGAIATQDAARIRLWPPQLSQQGFSVAFQRRTQRPEPEGQPSHWVLVAGRAQIGRHAVLLGLGLRTDEPTTLGRLALAPHQWLDVLRIKTAEG